MTKSQARAKAKELVAQMTAEEKMSQLLYNSPAIERLGIKEYNWWNEGAHGVARAGTATVFPHTIAMAATFNPELINVIADVISTEGRAKYNQHVKYNDYDIFKGLTFWAPNINIFRDPRWGRGQETFGEDPYLTATLGTAFIKGIQGDGEFLKASACSKHFAVHSGPEATRHGFDAKASLHDMFETYLPAFEKTVKSGVTGVMGAYNRTNGEPCCAHSYLLGEILRKQWEFDGYVVSDCGAIKDIYSDHHFTETKAEAAAVALKSTCDLNCGETYVALVDAYEQDLITDEEITAAAERVYTIRFLLGEFEEVRPYSDIGYDKLDCKEHKELNKKAAEQCLVLLKNKEAFLPLNKEKVGRIAVVGPNSQSYTALEGNYNGYASEYVTVADGIRRVFTESDITVERGSNYCDEATNHWSGFQNMISDGVAAAASADITVLALGLDCSVEGEDTGFDNDYTACGDKKSLYLPKTQQKLAEAVCDVCDNVVVVLMCGSSIDLGDKVTSHAKAIIHAWYPGALGGLAVANLLAGSFSPCGRLPVTIYRGDHDLPDFEDYSMLGRTYRYINGEALFPFGYGLSYTSFAYDNAKAQADGETVKISVDITNTGAMKGIEKAQVYASFTDSRTVTPHFQLCGIKAVELDAGEKATAEIEIDSYWLKAVTDDGARVTPDGKIALYIGGHQPDGVSNALLGNECIKIEL
ncbi:MAG: glycoside hydrolase family 3 C-terminal domain-containing protein [Clostridia bacterium]|nr:glycoside hydrolase family 3 C-terminal domain-containing protein [Clostridia bacterium]